MTSETNDDLTTGTSKHKKPIVRPVGEHNIFEPYAPLSPAMVAVEKVVYTSGQIGVDPRSGILMGGGPKREARTVLENLRDVMKHAGVPLRNVAKITLYLTDMLDMKPVLDVYKEYFAEPCPALSILQVTGLPLGATIQIDAVGYLSPVGSEEIDDDKTHLYHQRHED